MTSSVHILGVLLTVALLLAVSWLSGRNVRDARSFMTGGTSGTWMVGDALLGTMAGGQSTIGTAQLAFCYGLSAWWFTLGAAIGCLLLGYAYAGPLRRSGCTTLLVFFGGIRSAGVSGLVKLILLYFSSLAAGAIVWHIGGGIDGLRSGVETIYQSDTLSRIGSLPDIGGIHHRYGSLVARGVMKDLGGCLSLVLGVVSTQTYAQCIWSASTTRHARRGALICAFSLPLIGAACTLVGIYMRGHYITADEWAAMQQAGETLSDGIGIIENSAQAFPAFILGHLPSWLGGIMLGTLLINILGCGSGLSLGAATILVRDVYGNLTRKASQWSQLAETRLSIVIILVVAVVCAMMWNNSFINDLGFLSLGLRAVSILFPLSLALWMPKRFAASRILTAMPVGVAAMLAAKTLSMPGDAVYYGLAVELSYILIPTGKKAAKQ